MNAVERDLKDVVESVARRFARRCWWVDEDDLRQEGWRAALAALRRFDVDRAPTGSVKPFVRPAVQRYVVDYLLQNTSPVSARDYGPERRNLIGLSRAPVESADGPDERTAEGEVIIERWRATVLVRLREVVDDPAILASLLDGVRPKGSRARRATHEAIGKILADDGLRNLWKELDE